MTLRVVLDCLSACADELAALIDASYPQREQYEHERRRYERDMALVYEARRLVARALSDLG